MNRQKTILIVDDAPENIVLLAHALRDEYRLIFATKGHEALERATSNPQPDLILLDIILPDIDGYEVCRQLKADERVRSIPVIFVTALDEEQDEAKGLELGAVDYVTKPFNLAIVRARVHTHLELKNTTDRLRRYNEELEELVAEKSRELIRVERQAAFGQLIQGIVHNLKGPLTVIKANTELCMDNTEKLDRKPANESLKSSEAQEDRINSLNKYLAKILEGADRLNSMVTSLTARGRSDQSLNVNALDLNVIVQEELNFLDGDPHFKRNIMKDITLFPDPLPVRGVSSEIAQMFTNLLRNAIDAMHGLPSDRQKIEIKTLSTGLDAVLLVRDMGCGIASEHLEKIFDPFFSTKAATSSPEATVQGQGGTGLGLYTCLRTVNGLGGEITTQSEVGEGTTFRVTIPLAA